MRTSHKMHHMEASASSLLHSLVPPDACRRLAPLPLPETPAVGAASTLLQYDLALAQHHCAPPLESPFRRAEALRYAAGLSETASRSAAFNAYGEPLNGDSLAWATRAVDALTRLEGLLLSAAGAHSRVLLDARIASDYTLAITSGSPSIPLADLSIGDAVVVACAHWCTFAPWSHPRARTAALRALSALNRLESSPCTGQHFHDGSSANGSATIEASALRVQQDAASFHRDALLRWCNSAMHGGAWSREGGAFGVRYVAAWIAAHVLQSPLERATHGRPIRRGGDSLSADSTSTASSGGDATADAATSFAGSSGDAKADSSPTRLLPAADSVTAASSALALALPIAFRLCDHWEATNVWLGSSSLLALVRAAPPSALTPHGRIIEEVLTRVSACRAPLVVLVSAAVRYEVALAVHGPPLAWPVALRFSAPGAFEGPYDDALSECLRGASLAGVTDLQVAYVSSLAMLLERTAASAEGRNVHNSIDSVEEARSGGAWPGLFVARHVSTLIRHCTRWIADTADARLAAASLHVLALVVEVVPESFRVTDSGCGGGGGALVSQESTPSTSKSGSAGGAAVHDNAATYDDSVAVPDNTAYGAPQCAAWAALHVGAQSGDDVDAARAAAIRESVDVCVASACQAVAQAHAALYLLPSARLDVGIPMFSVEDEEAAARAKALVERYARALLLRLDAVNCRQPSAARGEGYTSNDDDSSFAAGSQSSASYVKACAAWCARYLKVGAH